MKKGSQNINHLALCIVLWWRQSLKPKDSQGVLMRFSQKKITQYEVISQATSFISFKSKAHSDSCAEPKMIYRRQLESCEENKEKITEKCITKSLFLKQHQIGTHASQKKNNESQTLLVQRSRCSFCKSCRKLYEPFEKQTVYCTLDCRCHM